LGAVLEFLGAVGGIILVDLALSGDNALVIGAAASGLPRRQRWIAIASGGTGAIILRISFAILATLLLTLPLLQALGGLLLLIIAVRLLVDREKGDEAEEATHSEEAAREAMVRADAPVTRGLWGALVTILLADVTMSLDNVLAIGALAHGNIPLLVVGLLLSIGILLLGSALVAELIQRLPWLLDVAALVLGWTAANMLHHDKQLGPILDQYPWTTVVVPALTIGFVLVADVFLRLRARAHKQVPTAVEGESRSESAAKR
jgi:YjbE family integral membrane protein